MLFYWLAVMSCVGSGGGGVIDFGWVKDWVLLKEILYSLILKCPFMVVSFVFFFVLATKESGGVCGLCKPPEPSVPEVCQEGL